MATTPELHEPQIAAARAAAWHQTGEALLTLEAARTFLNHAGLLLFAPRGTALGAPAPSFVEATLGTAKDSTTAAEADTARTLVARLVGEGSAVPLNLLGGAGDLPDFLVSTQAFPFVFTLRGDKGWKRPPETSGAVKVTPLSLRVYELLVEKGALTVAEIVPEIGREVTESAVTRSLGELWQILRVIPVLQQGEGETRWELLTSRYIKAVKAGANAGQPTALSALASHFLEQVFVASEDEIAGFLSPLTARSRVRDVLHGLVAGRQLAEGVIQGKAVLYMPDALPDFAAFAPKSADEGEGEAAGESTEQGSGEDVPEGTTEAGEGEGAAPRILRFEGGAEKDRGLRGKPFRRDTGGPARTSGPRPPRSGPSREGRAFASGGERRPFAGRPPRREGQGSGSGFENRRPAEGRGEFARPWDEDRANRAPRADGSETRPPRAPRREGGDRPSFGDRGARPPRREGGDRPFAPRREGDERGPRRFGGDRPTPRRREEGAEGGAPSFARGDRPQRPFRERTEGGDRPARPFRPAGDRPFRPSGDRPFRSNAERPGRSEGDRPYRPSGDRPFRPAGDRPARAGGDRPFRPRTDRPEGDRPPRRESDRPFRPSGDRPFRPAGDRPFRAGGDRPARSGGDRPFRPADDRPFRPSGDRPFRPAGDRPARPAGDRPFRPAGDRPFRPGGDRPARAGNDRPFRPSGDKPFRPGGRPPFGGGGKGRPGGGPGGRGGASGGFTGRPDRPARPPRKPRSEDES